MRRDYGSVYKEIRKSKKLSQEEVCGSYLSRSTLARFESNQTIPSYEHMRFLLKQVDMSFEEFEYLCNHYQPSERQQLLYDIDNLKNPTIETLDKLVQRCLKQLDKEPEDLPVQRKHQLLKTVASVRKSPSFNSLSTEAETLAQLLWNDLSRYDNWYHNDLIIAGTLLFYTSSLETIEKTADFLLKQLEKYSGFKRIQPTILSFFQQLTFLFLDYKHLRQASTFATLLIELAKKEKRYDHLARGYIALGLATNSTRLVQDGISLLTLTGESSLLERMNTLIKEYSTD